MKGKLILIAIAAVMASGVLVVPIVSFAADVGETAITRMCAAQGSDVASPSTIRESGCRLGKR